MIIAGVASILPRLLALRLPAGLTVDEAGVRGVRGSKRIDVAWVDLVSVRALGDAGPQLVVHAKAEAPVLVHAHAIGSDPAIVAAVIEHFRQNPSQRHELVSGRRAIQIVEQATL